MEVTCIDESEASSETSDPCGVEKEYTGSRNPRRFLASYPVVVVVLLLLVLLCTACVHYGLRLVLQDQEVLITTAREFIEKVDNGPLSFDRVYHCHGNPIVASGLSDCCHSMMKSSGVYNIRNKHNGTVSCGHLNCSNGAYRVDNCDKLLPGKIHVPINRRKRQQWNRDPLAVHTGILHRCTGNSLSDVSSCCTSIQNQTGYEGIFKVQNVHAGKKTCGFLNCLSGEFFAYPCQNMSSLWMKLPRKAPNAPAFRVLDDVTGPLGGNSNTYMNANGDISAGGQFPNPDDFMSQDMFGLDRGDRAIAGKERLRTMHDAADAQSRQAQCAGYITAAISINAGLALQARTLNQYCRDERRVNSDYDQRKCARGISSVLADASWEAFYAISAAGVCGQPNKGSHCGESITNMLGTAFQVAEWGSMAAVQEKALFPDSNQGMGSSISTIAGLMPQFTGDISEASRICVPGGELEPNVDYGLCAGYIVGSVTYIAAGTLTLVGHDDDYYENDQFSTILGGLVWIDLAAQSADAAAQYCGGAPEQSCGQDITSILASLFGVIKAISQSTRACRNVDAQGQSLQQPPSQAWCGALTSTAAAQAAAMAQAGSSAGKTCGRGDAEMTNCGSSVSAVLATFAQISSTVSAAVKNCDVNNAFYGQWHCAMRFDTLAALASTLSNNIGQCVETCPFVPGSVVRPHRGYAPLVPASSDRDLP